MRILHSVLAVFVSISSTQAEERPLPRVPDGFSIERAAASPLVKHPMMAGFDDRGRLFIAESSGLNLRAPDLLKDPPNFVRMLEDNDGDGVFDKSTIFADKMTLPMGALWRRGALYVASPPSIWKLEDTDDDGVADKRTEIVNTFGFSGNAASIHGCFFGPDGRLYWCDGRHGHEFTDADGNVVSKGKAARIFSCRPDGTDVRIFCGGGMDNPVEVDFTPSGEMIGSVNILLSRPRVDCLMHWVDGGAYPRFDQECVDEFQKTGDLLPPMTQLGHVAVSGMMRYRSDALGGDYTDNVFTTIFNTHKVIRSELKRSGATFTTTEHEFLESDDPDFHPTDVLEDADGSLLVIDTGGWFRIGCPTSQVAKPEIHGAIYRIRRKNARPVEDARGLRLDFEKMSPVQLAGLLDDRRPVVREKAVDRLAQAGPAAAPVLEALLRSDSADARTRLAAVRALAQADGILKNSPLHIALEDESENVRVAAARAVGSRRDVLATKHLANRVLDDSPAVRRAAATALGQIFAAGEIATPPEADRRSAVDAVVAGFSKPVTDRVLEHALIYALIRIADPESTSKYLSDPNPQVRRAALIALDQMEDGNLTREQTTALLDTDDPALQQAALDVVSRREGWAAGALALLKRWLAEPEVPVERASSLRGILLAQSADAQIQTLVAEALRNPQTTTPVRLLLLEVVARSTVEPLPSAWIEALLSNLRIETLDVQMQVVRIVQTRPSPPFVHPLREITGDDGQPAGLRVEALLALAPLSDRTESDSFRFLMRELASDDAEPLARLTTARALAETPLDDDQLLELAGRLDAVDTLTLPVLTRAFAKSKRDRVGLALVEALERSEAASALSADDLANIVGEYPRTVQTRAAGLLKSLGVDLGRQRELLASLESAVDGGDVERGRVIFFSKRAACAGCHSVEGKGGRVGPDLTRIGRIRTGRDLLEAVVIPSASLARGFRTYTVATDEGRVHTGVIAGQTADVLTLRTAELAEIRIPRKSIEAVKESSTSVMPKGFEKTLEAKDLKDLLAFLRSRR